MTQAHSYSVFITTDQDGLSRPGGVTPVRMQTVDGAVAVLREAMDTGAEYVCLEAVREPPPGPADVHVTGGRL